MKMQLKGEMSMLNVLRLQELDVSAICAELEKKRDEAPQFFMQSPIIVDCAELTESDDKKILDFDFVALKKGLLDLGFIPVGVRNFPMSLNVTLAESGWALMRVKQSPPTAQSVDGGASQQDSMAENASESTDPINKTPEAATMKSMTIERPVRSGQQVYAANVDMTVLAPTSAGSEIISDGSVHIYGALRGRVLAGARGATSARIYCQSLQAELIAIAGRYQLLDESDTPLKGKPAMIRLDGEKLIIEALV
jgi:septum site-determining protein MinC